MRRLVYIFRGGRKDLLAAISRGEAPDEFLYGLPEFRRAGWNVGMSEARPGRFWFKPLLRPLEAMFTQAFGLGFPLTFTLADLSLLRQADVIIATTDGAGLPVMLLKRLGLIPGRFILVSQGLYRVADALKGRIFGKARMDFLRWLFTTIDKVALLGEGDEKAFKGVFGANTIPCGLAFFGIDEKFWSPSPPDCTKLTASPDVLSVGSDILRDYETLLAAIGNRSCRIVTRLPIRPELVPSGTIVDGDVNWMQLRELYRCAKIVVIPIRNHPRDSGHSATLQAMACGKAVVLSDTPGIWDRNGLKHKENIWLVPPEDPQSLKVAIDKLLNDDKARARIETNARSYVLNGHTSADFGKRMVTFASEASRSLGNGFSDGSNCADSYQMLRNC